MALFSVVSFIAFYKIDIETLNVDRWSIITNFWIAFFEGDYAYFSSSFAGNPPGPMPFYFILALPFYLIGELGVFSLTGVFAFFFLLRYQKLNTFFIFLGLLFISSSTFYIWEVTSRSNVLINSSLILLSIAYFESFKQFDKKRIILTSIIVGCLLSTRNVFAIAYIIYFMYLLLSKKITFKQLFIITATSVLFFAFTFLPFVIGHFDKFLEMNPFLVQSTFLIPFGYTLMFLVFAFLSSFLVKNYNDVIFYIGLNLFISIFIYAVYLIIEVGFHDAYLESVIDISYFIFAIPFLLLYYLKSINPINPNSNLD
ncbi:MAG: hypothetical protein R6V37_07610 [Psychroflexus maritimus]